MGGRPSVCRFIRNGPRGEKTDWLRDIGLKDKKQEKYHQAEYKINSGTFQR
jgi:hypothetical protein